MPFISCGKKCSGKAVEIIVINSLYMPFFIYVVLLSSGTLHVLCLSQVDLLLRQDLFKEALQVAEAGTDLFKDSETMWQMKLQVLIGSKSPDIDTHFEEAFAHLKPQVCELCLSYFIH